LNEKEISQSLEIKCSELINESTLLVNQKVFLEEEGPADVLVESHFQVKSPESLANF